MLYSASLLHIPSSSHASLICVHVHRHNWHQPYQKRAEHLCTPSPHPQLFIEAEKPFMHFFQIRHCGSVSTESNWGLVAVFFEPTVTHKKEKEKKEGVKMWIGAE